MKIVAFTGPSNAGKTTLIESLVTLLVPGKKVVVVKHDPGDKASFDTRGKDSWRFFTSGADTLVVSPSKTAYFSHEPWDLDRIIRVVGHCDYLFIEGLRSWPVPRIAVFRESVDVDYLSLVRAVVVDEKLLSNIGEIDLPVFPFTRTQEILQWIEHNAMERN